MGKKLSFLLTVSLLLSLSGCAGQQARPAASVEPSAPAAPIVSAAPAGDRFDGLSVMGSMALKYARQFSVDYLSDGCSLISITESGRFLLVPEGQAPPRDIDADITVLRQPVQNIYLAATSAMCLFDALGALGNISMSGTQADGWYIPDAKAAMQSGAVTYAGKYSAPDYEMIMAKGCGLAIEDTMISHSPDVQTQLENLGVSVWIDRSSYETHPLGRTEWIKLYGLLVDKEDLAEQLFDQQAAYLDNIPTESAGQTVAFFYITSAGGVVVHRSGDYLTKMIELAGGTPAFTGVGDDGMTGSINLDMETFYADAKDADVIIYNSSIDGEVNAISEQFAKSSLLADFKAVKDGNVWCTSKNLFQETIGFGQMISDMNQIFTGKADGVDQLNFLYRLK